MGHKVFIDGLDNKGQVLKKCRDYTCDAYVRPSTNPEIYLWKRYILKNNCIFSKEEVIKWTEFVTRCGFKCEIGEDVLLKYKYNDQDYSETAKEKNCYTLLIKREDYKSDLEIFIALTISRMISYLPSSGYNYEKIVKNIFNIPLDIDPLEKLILGHYTKDFNEFYMGNHGISTRLSNNNSIKLQKSTDIKTNNSVNETFDIMSNANYNQIEDLIENKDYEKAYKILKENG